MCRLAAALAYVGSGATHGRRWRARRSRWLGESATGERSPTCSPPASSRPGGRTTSTSGGPPPTSSLSLAAEVGDGAARGVGEAAGSSATCSSWETIDAAERELGGARRQPRTRQQRYPEVSRPSPGPDTPTSRDASRTTRRSRTRRSPSVSKVRTSSHARLRGQMLFLRREQGRLDELVDGGRGLRRPLPRRPRLAVRARLRPCRARSPARRATRARSRSHATTSRTFRATGCGS